MGNKIRPDSMRLGIIGTWKSRWFAPKSFRNQLEEDDLLRTLINEKIGSAGILRIDIERTVNSNYRVIVKAARPGFIIGRGGKGIETLHKALESALRKLLRSRGIAKPSFTVSITIDELRRFEISAMNTGQMIAADLEKRLPSRRVMKKHLDGLMQSKGVLGARIQFAGRVDGAEIARRQWLAKGRLPLQTLRANIDYAEVTAFTTYGTIGIKVMIYMGDVFEAPEPVIAENR